MKNDELNKNCLSKINDISGKYPDPDSVERIAREKYLGSLIIDQKTKKKLLKDAKEAELIVSTSMINGAGNVADQVLRIFYQEYMSRLSNMGMSGLKRLPETINLMEAFFNFDTIFTIRPEIDYLINIEDFLDYITGINSPNIDISSAYKLKEGYIYNYTEYNDPKSCMFTMGDGQDYGICALSMIRRGDELTVMLVAGKSYTEDDKNKTIGMAKNMLSLTPKWGVLEEYRQKTGWYDLKWDVVQPTNGKGLWQHILLIRFDLKTQTYSARYVIPHLSNLMLTLCDDDVVISRRKQESHSQYSIESTIHIEDYTTLFELAKTCVLLPAYIDYRVTYIKSEDRKTELVNNIEKSLKARRLIESLPEKYRILIRKISAIRIINTGLSKPVGRTYNPPKFQVNIDGFWRYYVNKEWYGHDENGNIIKGKTWVKRHIRYKDKIPTTEAPKIIYIKSSLADARQKLEKYREQLNEIKLNNKNEIIVQENLQSTPSYLYVLRSPAHGKDIYKVGYTDRDPEKRAQELSSYSGSPVAFLVVQAWAVIDGRSAEKAAHKYLENFRLASNREFFIGQYSMIREKIETAIDNFLIR